MTAGTGEQSALVVSRVADALTAASDVVDLEVVRLREYAQELASALTSLAPERLRAVFETLAHADAIVIHTSIMNASFAGLLKVFIDVLPEGTLRGVPVLLVGTGGTSRHSLALDYALRPILTYLHAEPIPTTVFVSTADWGSDGDGVRSVGERIVAASHELLATVEGSLTGPDAQSRVDAAMQTGNFDIAHITDRLRDL